MTSERSRILPVVFLSSFASLAYEITLTRIFSISLWYHFAFMIISIAMLGLGASGTILSLSRTLRSPSHIRVYSVLLGVTLILSYLVSNRIPFDPVRLSWDRIQLVYILLYYVVLSAPFFFTGLIIAAAFSSMSEKSGLLYASDLLGAGAGSMVVLSVLTVLGPERVVFVLSSLALLSPFFLAGRKWKAVSFFLILLNLALLFFRPPLVDLRMSPYKGLATALQFPGAKHLGTYYGPFSRIDTFRSPAARFAPGLSLRYLEPLPEQIGIAVDGGELNAVTSPRDHRSLAFLEYLPSALPYAIARRDDVLILDPKGGLQVLVAERHGAKNISRIESDPLLIKVMMKDLRDFSGDIYGENTWQGLGRSRLKAGDKKYDIVDISLVGAAPVGSFGISEDYRFTVEAFRQYLSSLKADGIVSMNLYILPPPRMELRLLTTAAAALEDLGVTDMTGRTVAVRSWDSICILVKRSPFAQDEIKAIKDFAAERRFDLVHYPGIREHETNRYVRMATNDYSTAFANVLDPRTRSDFSERYLFDITPARDDSPFFHHFLRFKNIGAIYRVMGERWQYFMEEGYLLPAVFFQVLFLSALLIGVPAFVGKREETVSTAASVGGGKGLLPYFAFLGLGYMSVEVVLIHKAILPLENPSYAVATVLASMLISSGAGSLACHRAEILRNHFIQLLIAGLILCYSLLIPVFSLLIAPASMAVKIPATFAAMAPLGFLMGIPFPLGMKILGERNPGLIPWAWAINGCFSILAPILTVMLAMASGFRTVLWLGAGAYLGAYVVMIRYVKSQKY